MRVRYSSILLLLCALGAACAPERKCGGKLYYDPIVVACRSCPKDATFKNGTCECKAQYEFVDNKCVLMDGAVLEVPDAGMPAEAGMSAAKCDGYCSFAKACIANNSLASALPDVISGLHADDVTACTASCETETGGDGSSNPVVACIEAGRDKAACADDATQTGLTNAFTLLGDCCRPRSADPLCKAICKVLTANALLKSRVDFCP